MGLGNGNPNSGNKGSNYNYEARSLGLLGKILTALGGSPVVTTRIPTAVRTNAAATIPEGKQSVSIYNSGTAKGTIFGLTDLNPGEMVSFTAGDQADVLGQIPYDASPVNCEFLITTLT
jgi:hypothetical protein